MGNPVARVGNYAAPVDTSGMDESMKQTMNVSRKPQSPQNPIQAFFGKLINSTGNRKSPTTLRDQGHR